MLKLCICIRCYGYLRSA